MIDSMVRNFFSILIGWFLIFITIAVFDVETDISQSIAGFFLFFTIVLFIPLIFYLSIMYFFEKKGLSLFFSHSLLYPIILAFFGTKFIYDSPKFVVLGFVIYTMPYFAIRFYRKVWLA